MIILFVVNVPEFFLSHRLPLAVAAREAGFTVHVATGEGAHSDRVADLGFVHHLLPLSRSGRNPWKELRSLWSIYRLMRKIRPRLVHLVTIKPVLYGGLAARVAGVPAVVAAISGLGTVFMAQDAKGSWFTRGIVCFYRLALHHKNIKVVFQNPDDRNQVASFSDLRDEQTALIKGAGVCLEKYRVCQEHGGMPVVTFAGRFLKDKGLCEFVEAARLLRARGIAVRFWLAGSLDPENFTSITEEEVVQWVQEKVVEVLGYQNDIADVFSKSNIIVLPSYREGLPKVLIEAAACGRAVVTTDVPGCRDAIKPGLTGLLVPARDPVALADAIQFLIDDPVLRHQMGAAGRQLAESEFSIEDFVEDHLAIYQKLLEKAGDCK